MPVEITQRTEACHNRNIENRMVCVTKQVAGIHNPDSIQVIQGTGMHNSLKASSEMGRAHMAQFRKLIDRKLANVVIFDKVQRRRNTE